MHRLAASLLCAAVECAAFATPAPVYKPPKASEVWVKGWDEQPADRAGGRLVRTRDRLAIATPAAKRRENGHSRLLREVEGDFDLEVRVAGDFGPATPDDEVYRRAGVMARAGEEGVWAGLASFGRGGPMFAAGDFGPPGLGRMESSESDPQPGVPTRIRLTRRGDLFRSAQSRDGVEWVGLSHPGRFDLPRKLRVGVFAETAGAEPFEVAFDYFKLTQPPK